VGMMSAIWSLGRLHECCRLSVSRVGATNELSLPLLGLFLEVGTVKMRALCCRSLALFFELGGLDGVEVV
jgi:hypothetical protein